MHAQFEVQLSKEDYVIGLDALFGELAKLDPTRKRMIFQRLASVVLLILTTGWFFPDALTGLLFVILGYAVLEGLMGQVWLKSAHGASYDPSVGPQMVEFTDTAIADSSAVRKRQWNWDAVRRVHVREAALVFELVGWDMIVLPSRLWSSAEDRQGFIDEIRGRITRPIGEPVSITPAPAPMKADLFTLGAIGAFVDVCLIVTSVLPALTGPFGGLADQLGTTGAVLFAVSLSALLGYFAYRVTKAGLPRLNARSPAAATFVANALIWAFAVWLAATALGII